MKKDMKKKETVITPDEWMVPMEVMDMETMQPVTLMVSQDVSDIINGKLRRRMKKKEAIGTCTVAAIRQDIGELDIIEVPADRDVEEYLFAERGFSVSNTTYMGVDGVNFIGAKVGDLQCMVETYAMGRIREMLEAAETREWHFGPDWTEDDGGGDYPFVSYTGEQVWDSQAAEIKVLAVSLGEGGEVSVLFGFCDPDMNNEETYCEPLKDAVRSVDWATIAREMEAGAGV